MSTKPTLQELQAYLDSDFVPPAPLEPTQEPTHQAVHLFTDLDWQTEVEPPYPADPAKPELFHLLTITQHTLIGYYPHDTHTLGEPDAHYVAWAPLNNTGTPIVWN